MSGNHGRHEFIEGVTPAMLALIKQVAAEAAKGATEHVLMVVGIDTKDPIASQQVFAALRKIAMREDNEEIEKDRRWVRRARELSQGAVGKAVAASVALSVTGALHAIVTGVKVIAGR